MHPTLVSFGPEGHEVGLHTYGIMVALGFAIGIVLFWRDGRRAGFDAGRLLDFAFWSIVAGLLGARLLFVTLNARAFVDACFNPANATDSRFVDCTAALRFWDGGFVFYGGALGTGLVLLVFCRREGWSVWRIGDLAAPALAVGHVFGRLGCFFAGCCFGKACPAPWAVSFPSTSVAFEELRAVGVVASGDGRTPSLHPTQLYESAGEAALFALLLFLRRAWRGGDERHPRRREAGGLMLVYAGGYALLRFAVEIFRGDSSRRYVIEWTWPALADLLRLPAREPLLLSISQLTSLLLLAVVVVAVVTRYRRRPGAGVATSGSPPG